MKTFSTDKLFTNPISGLNENEVYHLVMIKQKEIYSNSYDSIMELNVDMNKYQDKGYSVTFVSPDFEGAVQAFEDAKKYSS